MPHAFSLPVALEESARILLYEVVPIGKETEMIPFDSSSTLEAEVAFMQPEASTTQHGRDWSPRRNRRREEGAVGWGVLWLIGVPIPILIVAFLLRGCT